MKNFFLLSLIVFGLTGCETYNHAPYSDIKGARGDYGFTYDLDNAPSPFQDTSYRPLTKFDLAAPIIVVVTNQPPPRIVYKTEPEIGVTRYSGETPVRGGVISAAPQILEAAGANTSGASGAPAANSPVVPSYFGGPGGTFFDTSGGTNAGGTNTNVVTDAFNITNTNTNALSLATNTNGSGFFTNTNTFAGGTNVNEPAGTQLQTNRPFGQPPGTQFRTNRFGEPAVPPAATNRVLFNSPTPSVPTPVTETPAVQSPVQNQAVPTPVQPPAVRLPVQNPSTPIQRSPTPAPRTTTP